jgi:integrase
MPRKRNDIVLWQRGKRNARKGDKIYYVQYRDPETGKLSIPKSTKEITRKAALEWAKRHRDDVKEPKSEVISFLSGLYEEGSEYLVHTAERRAISPTRIAHLRARLKIHIIPALEAQGIKYFEQLNIRVIEEAQKRIAKQVSASTMNVAFAAFRKALEWAAKKQLLYHDPFQGYESYIHHQIDRGVLTKVEVLKLWNLDLPDVYRLLIFIPLFCGIRIGELQALRFSSVMDDRLVINESYEPRQGFKGPKGSTADIVKARYTCFPTILRDVLSRVSEGRTGKDLVFQPRQRAKVLGNHAINIILYSALARIGICEDERLKRNIGNHSSRHFFNSFLLSNNINIYEVQHLLGHTGKALDTNPMTAQYFSPLTDFPKINKLFDDFVATPLLKEP